MVCDRHREVTDKLDDHDKDIGELKINYATMGTKIEALTDSVKDLVQEMKDDKKQRFQLFIGGLGTLVVLLAGFFIWYIQSIPK